jgi:16S rRNA C967 or C1407 C5-methylase (RsmB/RsmF family)/NOL1/NOP2/fmu family ribosome biogenesis protein
MGGYPLTFNKDMNLPEAFQDQMRDILGPEYPAFVQAMTEPPPVSIRLNKRRNTDQWEEAEQVPWHPMGRYLQERPVFTLDPLLHAGAYYVQEASSMFVAEAVRQVLDLSRPLRVLDLCAAPGGKSTLLADLLSEESLLVANEVIQSRYPILRENLIKWGFPNILTTRLDPSAFSPLKGYFDLVLVDAPCSGEGLFRKDPAAVKEWSSERVEFCASRQERILKAAHPLVSPGGWLMYTTCTYNDKENQQNGQILQHAGFKSKKLRIPSDWNICFSQHEDLCGYSFLPHRLKGEGFFLSVFQKEGEPVSKIKWRGKNQHYKPVGKKRAAEFSAWLEDPDRWYLFQNPRDEISLINRVVGEEALAIAQLLGHGQPGFRAGMLKKKQFIPHHELAMSPAVSSSIPYLSLAKKEALHYLKKEEIPINTNSTGWNLVKHRGFALGWIKLLPKRANNYYPKEWRIRMKLKNI